MAIETGQIVVDANQIKNAIRQDPANEPSRYYEMIVNSFSCDDFKSIFFLIMDFVHVENYLSLVAMEETSMKEKFMHLCAVNELEVTVIVELLGTMKKFKLLKDFGICKHSFKQNQDNFRAINLKWKMLYSICEELDGSELELIKNMCAENSLISSTEELICSLFESRKITENDFSLLTTAFQKIDRLDLMEKINSFLGISKEIKVYHIRNPTKESPCGIAIIINQEKFTPSLCKDKEMPVLKDRDGSQIDLEKLEDLWSKFGLKTEVHKNLKACEIMNVFKKLSQRSHHDVFVACVLSHGDKDIVYGSDCRPVKIDDIVSIMANKCPTLNNKPKLIFIQACQGNKTQGDQNLHCEGTAKELETDSISEVPDTLEMSDVLKAVATTTGYVSYRCTATGSLFITALVENLKLYGEKEDIEDIMKRVKEDIATNQTYISCNLSYRQMSCSFSTLRGKVIFKRIVV